MTRRKEDVYIGARFGRLIIYEVFTVGVGRKTYLKVKCICDCGNKHEAKVALLRMGKIKSCGCLNKEPRKNDFNIGDKVGRLLIKDFFYKSKGHRYANCICDCGREVSILLSALRHDKHTKSCGCLGRENQSNKVSIHGESKRKVGRYAHSLYAIWRAMKERCYRKKHSHYDSYGGRGINVCEEWLDDFIKFKEDSLKLGWQEGLTIERINVDRDYEFDNVTFIPLSEQGKNRRNSVKIEYNGKIKNMSDWVRDFKIPKSTFRLWHNRGISIDEMIERKKELDKRRQRHKM